MVELKGSLGGIGLPAIVQLIGELHHTGKLELSKDVANGAAASGALGFDDGRLISADFGVERGLAALTRVVLELADGDFRFSEGNHPGERTLDLSGAELQRTIVRIAAGEQLDQSDVAVLTVEGATVEPEVCPRLGFADDPSRNYSRPTALHRCYASIAPSLVTVQEQRDLCLSGRYTTCPRFRNASRASKRVAASGATGVSPVAPPPSPEPMPVAPPARELPAAVAVRPPPASDIRPTPLPPSRHTAEQPVASASPNGAGRRSFASRSVVLFGSGIVLGLACLALLVLVAVPALNSGLAARPSTATQAFEPVPAATRVPTTVVASASPAVAAARPSSVASPAPTSAVVVAAARATAVASPASGAAASRSLVDVRFASGMPSDWIDNAPYAAWSAGAYRLRALQAAHFVAVAAPLDPPPVNAVVSATFRKTGGPPGGGYGLIARDQGPEPRDGVNQILNAYVFETGDQGEFGVWRRDADRWIDLVPWTRSAAVRLGGSPNELMLRLTGDRLVFTVNGFELANFTDSALSGGGIGVFAGGDYNEVAVDHFGVQALD